MSGSRTTLIVLGSTKSREDKPQPIVYFHSEKVIYGGKSYNDGVFYLHFKMEIMPVVLRLLRSGQPIEVYYKQEGKEDRRGIRMKKEIPVSEGTKCFVKETLTYGCNESTIIGESSLAYSFFSLPEYVGSILRHAACDKSSKMTGSKGLFQ